MGKRQSDTRIETHGILVALSIQCLENVRHTRDVVVEICNEMGEGSQSKPTRVDSHMETATVGQTITCKIPLEVMDNKTDDPLGWVTISIFKKGIMKQQLGSARLPVLREKVNSGDWTGVQWRLNRGQVFRATIEFSTVEFDSEDCQWSSVESSSSFIGGNMFLANDGACGNRVEGCEKFDGTGPTCDNAISTQPLMAGRQSHDGTSPRCEQSKMSTVPLMDSKKADYGNLLAYEQVKRPALPSTAMEQTFNRTFPAYEKLKESCKSPENPVELHGSKPSAAHTSESVSSSVSSNATVNSIFGAIPVQTDVEESTIGEDTEQPEPPFYWEMGKNRTWSSPKVPKAQCQTTISSLHTPVTNINASNRSASLSISENVKSPNIRHKEIGLPASSNDSIMMEGRIAGESETVQDSICPTCGRGGDRDPVIDLLSPLIEAKLRIAELETCLDSLGHL